MQKQGSSSSRVYCILAYLTNNDVVVKLAIRDMNNRVIEEFLLVDLAKTQYTRDDYKTNYSINYGKPNKGTIEGTKFMHASMFQSFVYPAYYDMTRGNNSYFPYICFSNGSYETR